MVAGLVLAAGQGTRFGGTVPKQLAIIEGRPLVERPISALTSAGLDLILVVLGAYADVITATARLAPAEVVMCPDWAAGQSRSLRAGVDAAAAYGAEAVIVVLGDQPFVGPAAVRAVMGARCSQTQVVRATYAGRPGHPTLIDQSLFGLVARLEGDAGARHLFEGRTVAHVPCDGLGCAMDVDTPEDLGRLTGKRH